MVTRQNKNIFGVKTVEILKILINRICGAFVPGYNIFLHIRRQNADAAMAHVKIPGCADPDMRMLLKFFAAGRIQVRPLLREQVSPHDAPAVFTRLAQNDPTVMGTVFDWNRC